MEFESGEKPDFLTENEIIEKSVIEQVAMVDDEVEKQKDIKTGLEEEAIISNDLLTQEAKNILEADSAQLKVNTCDSTTTLCTLPTLKGFEFCHKHILEDKTSPYKRCNFLFKEENKRCTNPAPKLGISYPLF